LVTHARRWLRRVDVLVNNAGLYLETAGPTVRDRVSVFDARMEVVRAISDQPPGTHGALAGPDRARLVRDQGYPRLVNVTSAASSLIWVVGRPAIALPDSGLTR
jgi:NAD(P)-dependent dehydrogenase (short-subunit alcohol dehydrogenase family)